MTAGVLEQQQEVGAPRVSGPAHLRVGIGSKMADSIEGRVKIAAALSRYAEYCRYAGTPFPYHQDNDSLEVETGEMVGATSRCAHVDGGGTDPYIAFGRTEGVGRAAR